MKRQIPALVITSLALLASFGANFALADITLNNAAPWASVSVTIQTPTTGGSTIVSYDGTTSSNDQIDICADAACSTVLGNLTITTVYPPFSGSNTWAGYGGDPALMVGSNYARLCRSPYDDYCSAIVSLGSPAPIISFFTPDGSTTTPDFPQWKIEALNLSTTTLYRLDVVYSEPGVDFFGTYDDFNLANSPDGYGIVVVPKTQALTQPFASTTYFTAEAFLYATSTTQDLLAIEDPGDAIATATVSFYIGSVASAETSSTIAITSNCGYANPIFETTSTPPYFVINNPVPAIENGICNAEGFLFFMNSAQNADVNNRYQQASQIITTKPPLGYFSLITSAFSSFASGSSSVALLTASSSVALSPIFSPLDYGLAACIGLLGGFWLLRRLKHIQP